MANIFSMIANGAGSASQSTASGTGGFWAWIVNALVKIGTWIVGKLSGLLFVIAKLLLRIVEFFQFFAGRLTGIDSWSKKAEVGRVSLGDSDVIFRFLFSDAVRTAILAIFGLSILLLIIFTIIAIVRSDYATATDPKGEGDGNKMAIMKKAGKSLFLMLIVPVILLFGILGSNAVLASLANAIKGNSATSLGGTVFTASAYEANYYRNYAKNGERVPVDFGSELLNHVYEPNKSSDALGGLVNVDGEQLFVAPMGTQDQTSPYFRNWFGATLQTHLSEILAAGSKSSFICDLYAKYTKTAGVTEDGIYYYGPSTESGSENMNLRDYLVNFEICSEDDVDKYVEDYTIKAYSGDSSTYIVNYVKIGTALYTRVKWHVGLGGIGSILVGGKGETNITYRLGVGDGSVAFTEITEEDTAGLTGNGKKRFRKFNDGSGIITDRNGFDYVGEGVDLWTYVIPELTIEGKVLDWKYNSLNKAPITTYSLGYMSADYSSDGKAWNIINAVYNSWDYNERAISKLKIALSTKRSNYATVSFETAYKTIEVSEKYTGSNDLVNIKNLGASIFESADNYYYDGKLATISDEYYVMADFVDWTIEQRQQFYIVNASNKLIDWNDSSLGSAKDETFSKYVGRTNAGQGAIYDVNSNMNVDGFAVVYNSGITRYYECLGEESELDGETFILCTKRGEKYIPITTNNSTFKSSYLAKNYAGPIVARGIFDEEGNPTYIKTADESVSEIAYYGIEARSNSVSDAIYITSNSGTYEFVDAIDGSSSEYQVAKGVLKGYNASFSSKKSPISFDFVKVDDIYVSDIDGLQYITLHFFRNSGTTDVPVYTYVFTASVVGTPVKDETTGTITGYVSSLFNDTTVVTVGGYSYPTVALSFDEGSGSFKPSGYVENESIIKYIYFNREDVSQKLGIDFAIGSNGFAGLTDKNNDNKLLGGFFYFRFKVGFRFTAEDQKTLFNLTNGSATLDYNFNEQEGIAFGNLYDSAHLNYIILLFASVMLFMVLGQAIWGLIKRIYDVVILSIMYPAVASTLPVDDGSRFKDWSGKLVKAVLGSYGIILGINLFFVLLPMVRSATSIFSQEDIPASLQTSALFGNADFLNRIVFLMFMLVLFTIIKTLPTLISGLVGGNDALGEGADVKKNVGESIKAVGDVVSGQIVKDKFGEYKKMAGSFIPGGALISPLAKKAKDAVEKSMSNRLHKKAEAEANGGADGGDGENGDKKAKKLSAFERRQQKRQEKLAKAQAKSTESMLQEAEAKNESRIKKHQNRIDKIANNENIAQKLLGATGFGRGLVAKWKNRRIGKQEGEIEELEKEKNNVQLSRAQRAIGARNDEKVLELTEKINKAADKHAVATTKHAIKDAEKATSKMEKYVEKFNKDVPEYLRQGNNEKIKAAFDKLRTADKKDLSALKAEFKSYGLTLDNKGVVKANGKVVTAYSFNSDWKEAQKKYQKAIDKKEVANALLSEAKQALTESAAFKDVKKKVDNMHDLSKRDIEKTIESELAKRDKKINDLIKTGNKLKESVDKIKDDELKNKIKNSHTNETRIDPDREDFTY